MMCGLVVFRLMSWFGGMVCGFLMLLVRVIVC